MQLTINEHVYKIKKLNALQQFHVSRRLLPVLATLGVTVDRLDGAAQANLTTMEAFLPAIEPISKVLSSMSDEDADYVIFTCLSAVMRDQGEGRFSSVSTNNQLQFQDMDMITMLRLSVEVLKENLMGFFVQLGAAKN